MRGVIVRLRFSYEWLPLAGLRILQGIGAAAVTQFSALHMILQDAVGGTDQLLRSAVDLAQKPALQHACQGHHIKVRDQFNVGFRDACTDSAYLMAELLQCRQKAIRK